MRSLWREMPYFAVPLALLTLGGWLARLGRWIWAAGFCMGGLVSLWSIEKLLRRTARAEAQRLHLDEKLLHSQKLAAIGELSAGIAHEINNPLAIIRQEAEWISALLARSAPDGQVEWGEVQGSTQEIIHQVDRGKEITQNLLSFARKSQPVLQEVHLNRLIEDMARLVEKEAQRRNVKITREFATDLPPVVSDAPLFRQVILNLLNNAMQAIQGEGDIMVSTRVDRQTQTVVVEVQDSGSGIAPEALPHIFDPFFTTKPAGQGTGLGLSICYGIIHKLGGRLTAANIAPHGAVFTIILPLVTPLREGGK